MSLDPKAQARLDALMAMFVVTADSHDSSALEDMEQVIDWLAGKTKDRALSFRDFSDLARDKYIRGVYNESMILFTDRSVLVVGTEEGYENTTYLIFRVLTPRRKP